MNRDTLSVLIACIALACGNSSVLAYDTENAVPLTITAELGTVSIQRIAIQLDGRDLMLHSYLTNETGARQLVAFYATTPVFGLLGQGEEHLDKSFSDIAVTLNEAPARVTRRVRSYFRGHDITAILAKAKLGPLPELNADPAKLAHLPKIDGDKPVDWLASAVYSWSRPLVAGASLVQEVRYRALPQFALEELDSPRIEERVRRHCGDPGEVKARLKALGSGLQQVLVERYEVPVSYMAMREVEVTVTQPERNWLGARPAMTLVCGISGSQPSISGRIQAMEQSLSVLVISVVALPSANRHE